MEEKRYDVQAVKEMLNSYIDGEREVEHQTEMLERLKNKLIGVGAQEITDMPRSPSPPSDRLTDLVAQKTELEEEIAADIQAQRDLRKKILGILKRLKSADERAVIRFRYLLRMNWYDVTDAMFGGKQDYLGKEDSYQRRVFLLHGQALLNMAIWIEKQGVKIESSERADT